MKYDIVYSYDTANLSILVNRRIEEGWKPQGGVSVVHVTSGCIWSQAMVKEETK